VWVFRGRGFVGGGVLRVAFAVLACGTAGVSVSIYDTGLRLSVNLMSHFKLVRTHPCSVRMDYRRSSISARNTNWFFMCCKSIC
jgi:hypothetical protein